MDAASADWDVPSPGSANTLTAAAKAAGIDMRQKETELPGAEAEPRVISQSPRIYLFENLLSAAECDFLIALVNGRLKPAGVVLQTEDKHTVQTQSRNNEQIWITPQEESSIPVLKHILKRMHRVAHIPDTDAEALQIGRYMSEQKYESHVDTDPGHDVERPATLLTYLSDVEEGGDTLFPLQERSKCSSGWHESDGKKVFGCARCCEENISGTVRVRPRRGSAILFFNHDLNGKVDPLSEHAACPVRKGVKWIAQRWFRLKPHQNVVHPPDPRFDGLPSLPSAGEWNGRVRELSRKAPRVFLLENVLSEGECAHLVGLAETLGAPEVSEGVESWTFGEEAEQGHPVITAILKRLHRVARVPEMNAEPLELVRYTGDAPVPVRHDAGSVKERVATVLIYLSDADGGDTFFPRGKCNDVADCCSGQNALRVPPRKGRGLLFYARSVSGRSRDKMAKYGACPLQAGTKWVARLRFCAGPARAGGHPADPAYDIPALADTVVA